MNLIMGYQPIYFLCGPVALLAILAFCRGDSIWGTTIKTFNLFFASMVAINFFEPVANLLDSVMGTMVYYNDMIAFMVIFAMTMEILVEVTNRVTKVNVMFPAKVNLIGTYSILFFMFIGYYSITVFMFTTLLPEAPRAQLNNGKDKATPLLKLLEYESSYALKPMNEDQPHAFKVETFLQNQNMRNCAVYDAVDGSEGTWQFTSQSPNIGGK